MRGFDPNELADRLAAVSPSLGLEGKRAIVVEIVDSLIAHTKSLDEQEYSDSEDADRRGIQR